MGNFAHLPDSPIITEILWKVLGEHSDDSMRAQEGLMGGSQRAGRGHTVKLIGARMIKGSLLKAAFEIFLGSLDPL